MTQGRTPPPLKEHTFQNGVTVRLRTVSPMILREVRRRYPPPPPPMNTVDYGDGPVQEPNPADPAYRQALNEHAGMVGYKIFDLAFALGIEVDQTEDEMRAALAEVNAALRAIIGDEIDPAIPLKVAYLGYVCASGEEEMADLARYILRESMPTEEAVQQEIATFQSDI